MERVEFRQNEVIFKDGVFQNWMYSVCEGSVDIYSGYGTSTEKKLTTVTAGNAFGEIGLIAVMSRTATAVAAAETVVLEKIDAENFADYLKKHPENVRAIMSSVSRRIRDLTEDMESITAMTNELLRYSEENKFEYDWAAALVDGLFGKLKAKKAQRDEFAILQKRQKALSGEGPATIRFAAGDVIFRAGETADCMYDIYEGSVGIYSGYKTENEKLLATLGADAVFGEMGILDDMPRSATAVCLSDCTVLVIKPENFMQFFQDKSLKVLQILQQMCMQLRDLTKAYLEACKSMEQLTNMDNSNAQKEASIYSLKDITMGKVYERMFESYGYAEWMYNYL